MPDASSVHANVRAALRQRLLTLPWLVALGKPEAIAWQGLPWPPDSWDAQQRQPYLRETLKPNEDRLRGIGPSSRVRHAGLYIVDFFVPADDAYPLADTVAGQLLVLFPPNLGLSYGGQNVTIKGVTRSPPPGTDPLWEQVPVTVEWWANTINVI